MKQLQFLFLMSAMIFMITCKDPIKKHSARFTCNGQANNSLTVLIVDVNAIHIHYLDPLNKTIKWNMLDQKNFNRTESNCEERTNGSYTTKRLSLRIVPHGSLYSEHRLSIEFKGNNTAYHVEKVTYTKEHLNLTKDVFEVTKPSLHLWDNTEFKTGIEIQGYKCGETVFELTEQNLIRTKRTVEESSNRSSVNRKVEVKLFEFMFVALQNGTSTAEVTQMRCRIKPKNSNIPIYVGGGLLGVAAVVLVIYFVIRKRADSMVEKEKK